jgi:dimethylaniline monooxygenase (N-oxide forming)
MAYPKPIRVAIIGAGPSGLVTLKYLKTASNYFNIEPIEVRLFEAEASIGGTFAFRCYEDAELVSSRHLTTWSDFRCPESPDFLSAEEYCRYLADYCTHFDLWECINLNTRVTGVRRGEGGGHIVAYESNGAKSQWRCDAIAVCSGLHVTPAVPEVDGIKTVPVVMHSSEFKEKRQFGTDKNILILGSGETGMDLAYMAVNSPTKSVTLCHRSGFCCAPKV